MRTRSRGGVACTRERLSLLCELVRTRMAITRSQTCRPGEYRLIVHFPYEQFAERRPDTGEACTAIPEQYYPGGMIPPPQSDSELRRSIASVDSISVSVSERMVELSGQVIAQRPHNREHPLTSQET